MELFKNQRLSIEFYHTNMTFGVFSQAQMSPLNYRYCFSFKQEIITKTVECFPALFNIIDAVRWPEIFRLMSDKKVLSYWA